MIELISETLCTRCGLCVAVCPTNVFSQKKGEVPTIERQSDCQTCFMCELYCPVDAMYVAPHADETVGVEERAVAELDLLGSYRAAVGWGPGSAGRLPLPGETKVFQATKAAEERPRAQTERKGVGLHAP
ncbi:4Fe-4S dicluster domain-containing protein [Alicyclobacillus kakegawensis]|uniref:4Fe-4S dicluster domain-containing protein n=1 Tax=Alicyclobacillus kakegawensis TaxID=392012 RepID=UPI00083510AC|nr:ferredoxin family protein [Alicyclobacillus kakegawensis]